MGIHVPNFKVVFDYQSPVRATFELHMEVPLAQAASGNPEEVQRVKELGMTLAGYLDRNEWDAAAEFLSAYAEAPLGTEVIGAVFALKAAGK